MVGESEIYCFKCVSLLKEGYFCEKSNKYYCGKCNLQTSSFSNIFSLYCERQDKFEHIHRYCWFDLKNEVHFKDISLLKSNKNYNE